MKAGAPPRDSNFCIMMDSTHASSLYLFYIVCLFVGDGAFQNSNAKIEEESWDGRAWQTCVSCSLTAILI